MTDPFEPLRVAQGVLRTLEDLGILCTVGGSIAGSFAGEPRSTIDIDVVAAVPEAKVDDVVSSFSPAFYVDAVALRRAIRTRTNTSLIHHATSLKVDLFIAGGSALDAQQLARRRVVCVGDDITLAIHPPEDVLLQKLRWFKLGGEVSDRQWRDIVAIVRVQGSRLDREYLRANAPVIDGEALLERALASQIPP
jgi:hypothetical protein